RHGFQLSNLAGLRVANGAHEPGLKALAARGERRGRMRKLPRCRRQTALSAAAADGVARVPDLRLGARERAALPFRRRQDALPFARDIDTGALSEAELIKEVVDPIDAHQVGDVVEVHIARGGDRLAHIDGSVSLAFPIATRTVASAG